MIDAIVTIDIPFYYELNDETVKYVGTKGKITFNGEDVEIYANENAFGTGKTVQYHLNNKGQFVYRKKITNSAIKSNERFNEWLETLTDDDKEFFINTISLEIKFSTNILTTLSIIIPIKVIK